MTPDLSCAQCQDSLPWYLANSLSHSERAAMERHLASCERCGAALAEWREITGAIRRADERIPLDTASVTTWENISHQLGEQTAQPYTVNERTTMRLHDRHISDTPTPDSETPTIRPRGRVHAFVGLVAVVALIALSAGIFSHFATRGSSQPGQGPATTQSSCAPSQATAHLPAHTILSAIAPLGTDDGWAVGGVSNANQPASPPSALILRLRNCHWAAVGTPIPNARLNAISMDSADDGWAVGVTMTITGDYDQPLVLHYTHDSWQTVKVAANPQTSAVKVKMTSASDGWMLLYDGKHLNSANSLDYGYSLLRYQHGTWANVSLGFLKPSMVVTDLDARQPGEVWLVGEDITVVNNIQPAFVAHYAHGAWTPYIGGAIGAGASGFNSVSALAPNDVWVGGDGIFHFDGAHWSKASIHGATSAFMPSIFQIAMLSPTQGWAFPQPVGVNALSPGAALRYDHGVWTWTSPHIKGVNTPLPIISLAMSSPTQGWALGLHILSGNDQETLLLYYDAGAWGVVRQQS